MLAPRVRGRIVGALHARFYVRTPQPSTEPFLDLPAPTTLHQNFYAEQDTGEWFLHHLRANGFAFVSSDVLHEQLIDEAFQHCLHFFDLPAAFKRRLAYSDIYSHRGYGMRCCPGLQGSEVFLLGNDTPFPGPLRERYFRNSLVAPQMWRESIEITNFYPEGPLRQSFRNCMARFFDACTVLGGQVLRYLAIALKGSSTGLTDDHSLRDHALELVCLPESRTPAEYELDDGLLVPGTLGFTLTSGVSDRQLWLNTRGGYIRVPEELKRNMVCVHAGEMLSHYADIPPTRERFLGIRSKPGLALRFTLVPNWHTTVAALPQSLVKPTVSPYVCGDLLLRRLAEAPIAPPPLTRSAEHTPHT
eukprot:gnl/Spiro4/26183_TR13050_c0_g1_i1.p1 gnl/Spiro4/26183_TR13050_c0_g1~~gnl/Spiro4/26183_TR13050_c0_g1_i1.p1  ORF type:complete len:360 (+),score=64.68 gnl/Spiro4/26183_TR13050_c0_g1_i1:118-1197(+)